MKRCTPGSAAFITILLSASAHADFYVSSFNSSNVLRYSDSGVFLSEFISPGASGLSAPHRGIFLPNGEYCVASANNDRIMRFNGETGAFLGDLISGNVLLDYPVDLKLGPDGDLFVSSQLNDSILRYDFGSTTLSTFVASGAGGLDAPSGIDFGPDGNLYVSGRLSGAVHAYNGETGAAIGTGIFATSSGVNFGLEWGTDDVLYVANGSSNEIRRFDETGLSLGAYNSGGVNLPVGLEFGPDNALYVGSYNSNEVMRFDTPGTSGTSFLSGATVNGPNFLTYHVPEPGSAMLLLVGLSAIIARRQTRA